MPEVVDDLADLESGSHCIALFVGRAESREQAVSFLAGTPAGGSASFWVTSPTLQDYYSEELAARAPEQVGCVHVMPGPQVVRVEGRLRPTPEVARFVEAHPEGVTGGADTITQYWAPSNVTDHLEYEAWFQEQPRDASRFLCPYDLRRIPPDIAPETLRDLGEHHTHVALSRSREPAARLLQLFLFGSAEHVPSQLRESLAWARSSGLIEDDGSLEELRLTTAGMEIVREWSAWMG